MTDISRIARLFLIAVALGASPLVAVPSVVAAGRTVTLTQNADFFGGDYETVKDVDLDACQLACSVDPVCKAFTYNAKARWCFKKNDVGDLRPADGAIAGRVIEAKGGTPEDVEKLRLSELVWLPREELDQARQLVGNAAAQQVEEKLSALLSDADKAEKAKDYLKLADALWQALRHAPERSDLWWRLSDADILVPENADAHERLVRESTGAAVNGYLRAADEANRLEAYGSLANSFAARGEWKLALKALRERLSVKEDASWRNAYDDWTAKHGFRVTDNSVDTQSASPRICVEFSDPINKGDANISSYVKVDGDETLDVEAEDSQLCVVGVTYGNRYHVTVRKGLPAKDPEVSLAKSVELDVYVKDRDPSVRFLGKTYVLPRVPDASIPVVSVNVDTIDARVLRIGDRNLVGAVGDDKFLSQLGEWEADNVAATRGREVWSGKILVKRDTNREVTTAIPVGELVKKLEPGVYALVAKGDNDKQDWGDDATQWFVVSDLGLSTMTGNDGLHVVVRSLESAAALSGVKLTLVARDNDLLGEAVTDASGYAHFDVGLLRGAGGAAASLLTASTDGGDYAFIDLNKAPFDLTDRGVVGRDPPAPVDVFITTERGVYRPGESVALTILARNAKAMATENVPLTLVVRRPDGKEYLRRLVDDEGAGGRSLLFDLPGGAMRGTWRAAVYTDPKTDAIRDVAFKVEDFQPERLDFTLATDAKALEPNGTAEATVKADWLYGAPASGLPIEGEVELKVAEGLAVAPGYRFGLADELFIPTTEDVTSEGTGEDGTATVTLTTPAFSDTTQPLEANVNVRVMDTNGRPVERTLTLPIAGSRGRIGVKPLFDGSVDEGGNARFNVLALDAGTEPVAAKGLKWKLSRIRTSYQWYREDGSWDYHAVESTERVADGSFDVAADAPAAIEAGVEWGEYRLEVEDPSENLLPVSITFDAGWYVASKAEETPDLLKVSLDKPRYRVGDTVKAHLESRFPGIASIAVVDDRLIAMKTVEVPEGDATVDLTVTSDWGPGAYVTATLIRPLDVAAKRMPSRALGLAWAGVDPGDRLLGVKVDAPSEMRPQTALDVAVKVDGASGGEDAYVTVAAVDVGILNMTGFKAPAPEDWYFAQRRLGIDFRDVYGQLIDTMIGARGEVKSGGDGGGISRLMGPPPTERLVAFFQGVTRADKDGFVHASFPMPDFNGTVKVMAVAWSKTGVGHGSADVLVRDPVVIQAALPAFLEPGDTSRLKLDFTRVEGPSGSFALDIKAAGSVVALDAAKAAATVDLSQKDKASVLIPIAGKAIGDESIVARLTGPDGTVYSKELTLGVRDNAPPETRVNDIELRPGESRTFDESLFKGLKPASASATVTVGTVAGVDLPGLVAKLDKYPYGCVEQLTSRALPLLYLDDVTLAAGLASGEPVKERVEKAIGKILDDQLSDGSFGLWGASRNGTDADLWLDSYVTDFLTRAREKGYQVPASALDEAVTNVKNELAYAADFDDGGEDVAYALYVLARNGRASIGDLRYYAEAKRDAFGSPLAIAQVGAALALYGEPQRAEEVFRAAEDKLALKPDKARSWRKDYGSDLRDGAAMLALAAESQVKGIDLNDLAKRLGALYAVSRYTTTQEETWLLVAANAVLSQGETPVLDVGGKRYEGVYTTRFDAGFAPLTLRNDGKAAVSSRVTVSGIPLEAPPAGGNGYALTREYFHLDGTPADLGAVAEGTRLVVVLTLTTTESNEAWLAVDDPLPAGFAIDNPALIRAGEVSALDWLIPVESVARSEYRTDRFFAAMHRQDETTDYQFAYLVRAVASGKFALPAATVTDMYRPEKQARTDAGTVVVVGATK